jgi:hypothetical protein
MRGSDLAAILRTMTILYRTPKRVPKNVHFAIFGRLLQAQIRAESDRCGGTFSVSCDPIHVIQVPNRIYVENTAETLQALILLDFDSGLRKK